MAGGCLYLTSEALYVYSITNSTFFNCSAAGGGGIYSSGVNLTLAYNNFTSNSASLNGGAVYWQQFEPVFLNNSFLNNSALYGDDVACFGSSLEFLVEGGRRLEGLSEVASGQTGKSFEVSLIDKYGQVVKTDNSSTATLLSESSAVVLGGTTSVTAVNGVYSFSQYNIKAPPGSSQAVFIKTSAIQQPSSEVPRLEVPVSLRYCESGEILTEANQCLVCSSGQYSLADNSTLCSSCPSAADCLGGSQMYPKSGYWRSSNSTDVFFSCLLKSACLGSDNFTNSTGVCQEGYQSNLCQSCETDWSRTSKNTCGPCPDEAVNFIRLALIGLAVVAVVVVMVKSTLKSAAKPKELHSVYIKILANYLQLVLLLSSFNLNWPSLVKSLLSSQETAGSATDQLFSFDCFLQSNKDIAVFYQKVLIVGSLPIVILVLTTLFWGSVAIYRGSSSVLRNQMVTTLIVLFFLVHPSIVQTMFKSFSCMEIDPGESWLLEDLSLQCWEGDHSLYSIAVGLPGLIVWGMGIPAAALGLLIRRRYRLRSMEVKTKFGFLYIGYTNANFYWEFVILYRKIAIAFASVFLSSVSVSVQALVVMLIILVAFNLQVRFMPYENTELNQMEIKAILVAGVTIYSGLFFLTDDLSEPAKVALFGLILTSNIYFFSSWLFGISKTLLEKLAKKKPYLVKTWCSCIPSLKLAAELAIQDQEGQLYYGDSVSPLELCSATFESTFDKENPSASHINREFGLGLKASNSPYDFLKLMIRHTRLHQSSSS
jgi:hypothetical protein